MAFEANLGFRTGQFLFVLEWDNMITVVSSSLAIMKVSVVLQPYHWYLLHYHKGL